MLGRHYLSGDGVPADPARVCACWRPLRRAASSTEQLLHGAGLRGGFAPAIPRDAAARPPGRANPSRAKPGRIALWPHADDWRRWPAGPERWPAPANPCRRKGDAVAKANLGHSYRLGRGGGGPRQALAWYRKRRGRRSGRPVLARSLRQRLWWRRAARPPETVRWFRRAADDGHEKRASTSARSTSADLAGETPAGWKRSGFCGSRPRRRTPHRRRAQLQLGVCHEMGIGTAVSAVHSPGSLRAQRGQCWQLAEARPARPAARDRRT